MAEKISRPPLHLHISELWRANKEFRESRPLIENVVEKTDQYTYPILVIPGFLASPVTTEPLRRLLKKLGYQVFDWGLGRNFAREGDLEKIQVLLDKIHSETGQKVTIIGWSLGGIYARRLAMMYHEKIRRVITLGSPYKNVHAPNYATWLIKLMQVFRRGDQNGPDWLRELHRPVPVPSTAFFSKDDGIVPWQVSMDPDDPTDHENIEVRSSHTGLGVNKEVFSHLIDILEKDISMEH